MKEFIQEIVNEILTEETTTKNVVAIYPGRFQPMGSHHAKVYKWVQSKFGKNNSYISTSTKVEKPKSPLSFSEKEMVIRKHGFKNIIQINAMYNGEEYFKKLKFKPTETALVMIVGEKDGERLSPKYFQKISQSDNLSNLKPYLHTDDGGNEAKLIYWMAAPHISLKVSGFGEMSGTTIRAALGQPSDNKEKLFKDIMGFYDKRIYDTIVPKFEELYESLYIPKSVIERWAKTKSKSKLNEISTSISPASAKMVDDGPNFYIPNNKVFMNVSAERAAKLGWEVVKQITSGQYDDYYEHPIYPQGPPKPVPDAENPNASNEFDVDNAQEKWLDHMTRKMTLVGWSVIKDKVTVDDLKIDKKLIKKSLPESVITEIPIDDLVKIDQYADKQLNPVDVVLTDKHFFDRLTDLRNDKPITSAELIGFFKRLSKNKKRFIEFLKQYGEVVAKDNRTNINIPFMTVANKLIAKTVMRKSDFKTSNPKFAFEGLFTTDNALKPYEKLLIGSIIEFMRGKYGISSKIIVKKKQSRDLFGDIVLNDNTLNKDKFYLHFNPNASYSFIIESIIHELIHVKQISKGELRPSSDYKELLWKGKPAISVSDYKKFQRKDYNEYKKLPWEAEAYSGMKPLYREFLKSKQLQSLKGKDENLDYIISNLTENLMMGYPDQKWIDDHNKELKRLRNKFDDEDRTDKYYTPIDEDITLDVKVGDTILMGKFKNKKVVVKSIGTDEHGMPTINGKKVVTFRKLKTEGVSQNELITSIRNSKDPIDNRVLLTCGGAAGHMMHLSDDLDLTFGELKQIVKDVLQGNIKTVTEKLDGQNLMMSWKGGKAIFARNKGHIKGFGAGAMDALGVKQMFSGRGDLEEAFYTAAFDLQNAISKLSQKQRDKIFGEGSKWMNFEVMYPATTNVIPYNHTFLVFHGSVEYDESGNPIGGKGEDANILAGMIKQVNANLQSKYEIRGPVKLTITPAKDFSQSQSKYLSQINKLQSEFKLKDSDKVGMYHYKYWETFVDKKSPTKLDDVTKNGLVLRWAYDDKSFRLDKNTLPDVKTLEWAKGVDKGDLVKLRGENMNKFDVIFLQLGAEVLKNMSGFLAANPDAAVQSLRKEIEASIPKLMASDDPKMIELVTRHVQRLEKMGGLDMLVPTEGIVFNYNGKIYKMTGIFSSANQILGAFRYGR